MYRLYSNKRGRIHFALELVLSRQLRYTILIDRFLKTVISIINFSCNDYFVNPIKDIVYKRRVTHLSAETEKWRHPRAARSISRVSKARDQTRLLLISERWNERTVLLISYIPTIAYNYILSTKRFCYFSPGALSQLVSILHSWQNRIAKVKVRSKRCRKVASRDNKNETHDYSCYEKSRENVTFSLSSRALYCKLWICIPNFTNSSKK